MALPKAVGYVVILLTICCIQENQGNGKSLNVFNEELNDTKGSPIHVRENRATLTNSTDYELQAVISISNLEDLRMILNNLSFPLTINTTSEITSIDITTVCSSSLTGDRCTCGESFACSYDSCIKYGTCDAIAGETCGCINGIPNDNQYNISQTDDTAKTFTLTLNMDFNPSYNDPSSKVFQDINKSIQNQCKKHISTLRSANLISFKSGSTIATFTVSATTFQDAEITALKSGLFTELSGNYSVIFDSTAFLKFDPKDVFFEHSVTVTCGPPPAGLNFGTNWTAEWTRNGSLILADKDHSFSRQNRSATLTVSRFFRTDIGLYECKLIRTDRSVFREKSNGSFTFRETPVIQVKPLSANVKCGGGTVSVECSVNSPYEVQFPNFSGAGINITHLFSVPVNCTTNQEKKLICQSTDNPSFKREITLTFSNDEFVCFDDEFGNATEGFKAVAPCKPDNVGEKTAVCKESGKFEDHQDNCILQLVQELFVQSESLNNNSLPEFLDELSNITGTSTQKVTESPATIRSIVEILRNVANASSSLNISISRTSMEDVLFTVGNLTTDKARDSWNFLNTNDTRNMSLTRSNIPTAGSVSSLLLQSLETITRGLTNDTFDIDTPFILLNKTTFTDPFSADFNSSVEINIPESDGGNKSLTVITFSSMDKVLPTRDEGNSSLNVINGRVVLVQSSGTVNNISLTFDVINNTLDNPQCVFWNFSFFDGLGGWDDQGCKLVFSVNRTVTCSCNHLTSFSILMSPNSFNNIVLDYITYIGAGISIGSLFICLLIESVIWRKIRKNNTSYLRHVSIVNIAVSLLIADIWFIIAAFISDTKETNSPACTAATFFIHYFYLALFFWMLASGLLLLYRTVAVFEGGLSQTSMLAIGFSLGYGAPIIIATLTIAVTAPRNEYQGTGSCWLNWYESKALLAFVTPVLSIVLINVIILLVVIYKMLRRNVGGSAAQATERHMIMVIARSLVVLTPCFGLTWGLGVGTIANPDNEGFHFAFALFNSLQGFFILVFGTLLDKKVWSELATTTQQWDEEHQRWNFYK